VSWRSRAEHEAVSTTNARQRQRERRAGRAPPSLLEVQDILSEKKFSLTCEAMSLPKDDSAAVSNVPNLTAVPSSPPPCTHHVRPIAKRQSEGAAASQVPSPNQEHGLQPRLKSHPATLLLHRPQATLGSDVPAHASAAPAEPDPRALPQHQSTLATSTIHQSTLQAVQEDTLSSSEGSGLQQLSALTRTLPQPQVPCASPSQVAGAAQALQPYATPRTCERTLEAHSNRSLAKAFARQANGTKHLQLQSVSPGAPTLDQMLAAEAGQGLKHSQRGSCIGSQSGRCDAVAATAQDLRRDAPAPARVLTQGAPRDSPRRGPSGGVDASSESSEWDVMGTHADEAPALAPSTTANLAHGDSDAGASRSLFSDCLTSRRASSATGAAGASPTAGSSATLTRVPVYETGEPQFKWGDGGGRPPMVSRAYQLVMAAEPGSTLRLQQHKKVRRLCELRQRVAWPVSAS
jgi:hypothetical protein